MFDINQHVFQVPQLASILEEAVEFFENSQYYGLTALQPFVGSGVYAIYYHGKFEPYNWLSTPNQGAPVLPIYVGKAVPSGRRTGQVSLDPLSESSLYGRLGQHKRSIDQTNNLVASDFHCRFVVLRGIASELTESLEIQLIARYRPLWNQIISGFGNHDPGKGRYYQSKSQWDVLHPGRTWADRLKGIAPTLESVLESVAQAGLTR